MHKRIPPYKRQQVMGYIPPNRTVEPSKTEEIEIPDNSLLAYQFQINHPYLARELSRARWKNWRGL